MNKDSFHHLSQEQSENKVWILLCHSPVFEGHGGMLSYSLPAAHVHDEAPCPVLPQYLQNRRGNTISSTQKRQGIESKLLTTALLTGPEAGTSGFSPCSWLTVFWLLATSYLALLSLCTITCKMEITPPSTQDSCGCRMRSQLQVTLCIGIH